MVDRITNKDRQKRMKKAYFIAIDGGGTKTEGVLCTAEGEIVCRRVAAATNPNDVGIEESRRRLAELAGALRDALPAGGEVAALFAGVAGAVGNGEALREALGGHAASVRVDTDAINLLSCAGGGDGACLVCGTGSVCFARRGDKLRRIGGWGCLLDGAGSGYDIGRDAIAAALRVADGRGAGEKESTLLCERVRARLGKAPTEAIPEIYRGGKSFIASLAPEVFAAAREGDPAAADILDRNAAYLAELIAAAERYVCDDGGCETLRVMLGGSILTASDELYTRLCRQVSARVELVRTPMPQVYGALCEALKDGGAAADEKCAERFLNEYKMIKMNDE